MKRLASSIRHALAVACVLSITTAAHAQEQGAPAEGLNVTEVQVGTSLENGLVTSPQTSISRTAGRIFAVIRLANPASEATSSRVAFERVDGTPQNGLALDVPAQRRYRTVARFGASHPPGRYRVVIRTEDGTELQSVELTITE